MTTISHAQHTKTLSYLQQEILTALPKALASTAEGVAARPAGTKAAYSKDLLWFKAAFDPADFGFVLFGVSAKGAQALGAPEETFARLGTSLASSFSTQTNLDVRAKTPTLQTGPSSSEEGFAVELTVGGESFEVIVWASSELLESLSPENPGPKTSKMLAPINTPSARNLELLLDVEMPVSISFGKAQLPLKEVFKLTIGSVVELNRAISEPVEIIVNNAVIARGEVVVVEGNFGVRVTQVMSKQDRLQSLT
jgi:flagellar motor switch protein FliN/FliY